MVFKKGNKIASKGKRVCANFPFCKNRIPETNRSNQKYCSETCKNKNLIFRKNNKLIKKSK